jgi:twitching motility protein PilT
MTNRLNLVEILTNVVDLSGSDLHLAAETPPRARIHGTLIPLDYPILNGETTHQLAYSVMSDHHRLRFEETREIDFSFEIQGIARFRANIFMQKGTVAAVLRVIPLRIKSLAVLQLPPMIEEFCRKPRGLILITGPTGSGKSTTLAAMVDQINRELRGHIVTIEDPIEFLHRNKNCLVTQREVYSDTPSFTAALKAVLREDPDVVLIGEMRDLDTIEAALRVAETGHLTLATLHTNSAAATINRIIDVFPPHQQPQIRTQLSMVLEGIACQILLSRRKGEGRVPAVEILVPNAAVRSQIREHKVHQIYTTMQTGQNLHGMQTMNQSIAGLFAGGLVSFEDCLGQSSHPAELRAMLRNPAAQTAVRSNPA